MTRQQIIATAAAENGAKENPPNTNQNKYGAWYGMNGVPWCAIFVSWVFDKAGLPLGKIDSVKGFHYCPSAYNYWKRNNQLTYSPQPGDIVLYDWRGDGLSDHTGIFVTWVKPNDTFTAWEGNTSFNNDSDGGQVMLRTRSIRSVKSFVSPAVYGQTTNVSNDILQRGDQSSEVARIQKMLFDLKYDITVDGDFGPATRKVVKQFQKEHGLEITGIVDLIVEGALAAELQKPKVSDHKLITGSYLKKGDSGAAVATLQNALNRKDARPAVNEDGVFGITTQNALKAFQKKNKLLVDGIAGPQTFQRLGMKNG